MIPHWNHSFRAMSMTGWQLNFVALNFLLSLIDLETKLIGIWLTGLDSQKSHRLKHCIRGKRNFRAWNVRHVRNIRKSTMPFTRPTDNSRVWHEMSFHFLPIESYEVCYRRFWAQNYTFSISKSKWCSRKWDFLIHVFSRSQCLASNGPFPVCVGLLILASTRVNCSQILHGFCQSSSV